MPGSNPANHLKTASASIIIPVRNGAEMLRRCLAALEQQVPDNCEIVIVDDCSTDDSAEVAAAAGCRLVRSKNHGGPGAARNLGAQAARGEVLIFLDADVCVHRDTLRLLLEPFGDESVGAVFGSYNADPHAPHLISRFRNLLHHYVHQTAFVEASTFWAGCGAVRRRLLFEIGGFDPTFATPSVEDIDLGLRLRKAGHRIVVNKDAQVTHLKRWTLWSMCTTDLWRRGVPWSRLILRERRMSNDLNLKLSQRLSVALTFVLLGLFGFAAWSQPWIVLIPLLLAATMQVLDSIETKRNLASLAASGVAIAGAGLWVAIQSPTNVALGLAAGLGTWLLNSDFYRFLSRSEGTSFAIAVFPLHLLFYAICGLAFVIATLGHLTNAAWPFQRSRVNRRRFLMTDHQST